MQEFLSLSTSEGPSSFTTKTRKASLFIESVNILPYTTAELEFYSVCFTNVVLAALIITLEMSALGLIHMT